MKKNFSEKPKSRKSTELENREQSRPAHLVHKQVFSNPTKKKTYSQKKNHIKILIFIIQHLFSESIHPMLNKAQGSILKMATPTFNMKNGIIITQNKQNLRNKVTFQTRPYFYNNKIF